MTSALLDLPLSRRSLIGAALAGSAGALAGGATPPPRPGLGAHRPGTANGQDPSGASGRPAGWFEISLAQWSLHRKLYSGQLEALDFPAFTRSTFGIGQVEYVNSFFKDFGADFAYLRELRERCADNGVQSGLIMCDGEGELGSPDAAERRRACERHFRWISAAAFLGCRSVRVNVSGAGTPEEHSKQAADSLHHLADVAQDFGLFVLVENHGGITSNGAWLADTIRRADHPRVGTLPDFGNFQVGPDQWYDRYQGVAELMPFARAVSAKSHDFDARGEETHTDYHRMVKLVLEAGYRGPIGIEYEGPNEDEVAGIWSTLRLLERVRAELAEAR